VTALTLRAVSRLALRQTEGLIGSIPRLLGLEPAIPDHTTLSRRATTLQVPRPSSGAKPRHLLVGSTGLKLGGPGAWPIEKHGTKKRRAWRKLHLGVNANAGRIVAAGLTTSEVDDGSNFKLRHYPMRGTRPPMRGTRPDPLARGVDEALDLLGSEILAGPPLGIDNPSRATFPFTVIGPLLSVTRLALFLIGAAYPTFPFMAKIRTVTAVGGGSSTAKRVRP
jgi:hypothetical protein